MPHFSFEMPLIHVLDISVQRSSAFERHLLFCSDLPELGTVTVQIYKENDAKTKKDKRKLVGKCLVCYVSELIGLRM